MASTGPSVGAASADRERDEQGRPTVVAQSCLDFLMIEMVPMAQRTTNAIHRVDLQYTGHLPKDADPFSTTPTAPQRQDTEGDHASPSSTRRSIASNRSQGKGGPDQAHSGHLDEDELREQPYDRLESVGYRVGQGAVES
ncbi:MAG: hypothetical protein Q9159_006985, partial [Coniocarpon cinnabarinum]